MWTIRKHAYPAGARRFSIELPAKLVTPEYAAGLVISTELVIRPPCECNDQTELKAYETEHKYLKVQNIKKDFEKLTETEVNQCRICRCCTMFKNNTLKH